MRLGPCLLFKGRTLQGAYLKLAYFCSAPVAGFYTAVDSRVVREWVAARNQFAILYSERFNK